MGSLKSYSVPVSSFDRSKIASARLEDVDASFKDLAEVCGRIKGKSTDWAKEFLDKASKGEIPVLYKRHNKGLGHRRELGGKKGRYPKKAARIVLKVLNSAIANAVQKSLSTDLIILHASANKKHIYGRMAPKGGLMRSDYETARVEVVLVERRLDEVDKKDKVKNKTSKKKEGSA